MLGAFDISLPVLLGQLVVGLINGAFYAMLSLGLAVIFGLLRVINFAHGTFYMLGALFTWYLMRYLGVGYWMALFIAPLGVAAIGATVERLLIARIYKLDHLYGMLLTFGVALFVDGAFHHWHGTAGLAYSIPSQFFGVFDLGFMVLPIYRAWVIFFSMFVCIVIWILVEKTQFGAYLRAATEKPDLVQVFGINVPRMLTLTYALGAALAGLAGVLAAPIYQVNPLMGENIIIISFAVVVIGGMGSIFGSVITGYALGLIEGFTKVIWPEASATVIFLVMAIVLLIRPSGLFGKE